MLEKIGQFIEIAKEPKAYRCWMCGIGHNDAAAFLWHINMCSQEAN
jgi:hypothetical protein